MSEIEDEGLLPPNVHHARPEKPEQTDEDAARERAAEGAEEEGTHGDEDPHQGGRRHPHAASAGHRRPDESDDPYAKPGEDPYGERAAATPTSPEHGDDPGRVDDETGEAGTGEPPD
ncbi:MULTISPECIES: hypothetical protein [unclassified Microbacterium]|uniref:hypothetical protein n=1 Tax=unclassified Microbacterium TaxID=2609290 RepID=UPI0036490B74